MKSSSKVKVTSAEQARKLVDEYKVNSIERLKAMIAHLESIEEYETCILVKAALTEKETGREVQIVLT